MNNSSRHRRTQLRGAGIVLGALIGAICPATASGEITVDAPPVLRGAATQIANVDLARLREALGRAGLALPAPIHATLIPDGDPRASAIPRWIVGLAVGPEDIVIFPDRVLSYPYDSLESVVRHEITHLALTAGAAGQPLPRWFHEGVAVSVDAGWGVSGQLRLLVAMLERPALAQVTRLFASASETETTQAYLLSAALVHDLRRRHGADVPGGIATRVAEGIPFDRAFVERTGESPDAAAARAWASYLRWSAWVPTITGPSATWALILLLAVAAYIARARRRARRRRAWDEEEGGVP